MSKTVQVKQTSWFLYFASLVILFGIIWLVVILRREKTFPPLPVGTYVGQITGMKNRVKESPTLYVEHAANAKALLVVVFSQGWQPQLVPIERHFDEASEKIALTEDVPYKAVSLVSGSGSYLLSGGVASVGYRGNVESEGKRVGVWNLEKVKQKSRDMTKYRISSYKESVKDWLRLKSEFVALKDRAGGSANSIDETKRNFAQLKRFVTDGDVLRARAQLVIDNLTSDIAKATASRSEAEGGVRKLVSELNLLGRITKRGKSISLARKVALREQRWYLANWRAQEDATGIEEFIGSNARVDLRTLEAKYKKARNAQAILNEIAAEKRKISELEGELLSPKSDNVTPTYDVDKKKKGKKEKPKSKENKKSFFSNLLASNVLL